MEAFRQGKRPSVEEFARRYPEHADEIREMLPALVLMEKAKSADDAPGSTGRQAAAAARLAAAGGLPDPARGGPRRHGRRLRGRSSSRSAGTWPSRCCPATRCSTRGSWAASSARRARRRRLHHTNIVPVFGVGEQDGLHYYVMQFIQGLGLDLVLDELRRLRQPRGKPAATQGDAPGGPTDVAAGRLRGGRGSRPALGGFRQPGRPAIHGRPEACGRAHHGAARPPRGRHVGDHPLARAEPRRPR